MVAITYTCICINVYVYIYIYIYIKISAGNLMGGRPFFGALTACSQLLFGHFPRNFFEIPESHHTLRI